MERSTAEIADAVGYVCRRQLQLRQVLASGPGVAALDAVIGVLRAGGDPRQSLDDLHRALREAGDALGVFGRSRGLFDLAGSDRYARQEPVLLCPQGGAHYPCARFAFPAPGVTPRCEVSGEPLRRDVIG
ncbi:hypothetical protein FKN01_03355 [Streptomyces sp. 130]|uniref:hypothetical protein n=1 Tax=Streptomyces sp. 130 TaxID=2591006 RepID=UPI00117F8645|nr:hypothetical protein [Streptomyces sp. 130]TRV81501.1 hypothetical protein FKN01_03355 [Streptomyces sp. 130]